MKKFLLASLALGFVLLLSVPQAMAGKKDTKLDGTLAIEFGVVGPNPEVRENLRFTVWKDKKVINLPGVGDLPVPDAVRGRTYEVNAACPANAFDGNAGLTLLRVHNGGKKIGTVYRTLVTSGAASCLSVIGAKEVLDGDPVGGASGDDPFLGVGGLGDPNFLNLVYGEIGVWDAQILEAANDPVEGDFPLSTFFAIPVDQTEVEIKHKAYEISSVPFNRGGSAEGHTSSAIELKFKKPKPKP